MKIKISGLSNYLSIFNGTKWGYFDHILYNDTEIYIRGNYISGFITISYKDIVVVEMVLDNFPFGSSTDIKYSPCDEIVAEINKAIKIANTKCELYLGKAQEKRIRENERARTILKCK